MRTTLHSCFNAVSVILYAMMQQIANAAADDDEILLKRSTSIEYFVNVIFYSYSARATKNRTLMDCVHRCLVQKTNFILKLKSCGRKIMNWFAN